jgi:hypothetical protein
MLKETTLVRIEESIIKTFENDNDIIDLYDPTAVNISKKDIPNDILKKLKEYDSVPSMKLKFFDFILDDRFCGYVVVCEQRKLLVSFGLKHRETETKNSFFTHIKRLLEDEFICIVYKNNVRSIKWLNSMGMTSECDIEHDGHPLTVLKYISKFKI